MKDEEMAKEYAKAHIVQYPKRVIVSENGFCTSEDEVKQAFLAGLKAGRPQWHTDPNDLPEEWVTVLVMLENGVPYISHISTDKRWFCTDYYTGEDKVIAWCEIPQFKEIEK